VAQEVHLPDGSTQPVRHTGDLELTRAGYQAGQVSQAQAQAGQVSQAQAQASTVPADGPEPGVLAEVPLGRLCGARSGDKGGDANVGLWAVSPRAYAWLRSYLTTGRLKELLTEAAGLEIDRYELPNLLAVNFVVHGILAPGVSATARPDAQAKGLGEYIRSRTVPVPADLLG
jgi:hypothetical protein